MEDLNLFNSVEALEPKCPECGVKIDYGITTDYSDKHETHVCKCGYVMK